MTSLLADSGTLANLADKLSDRSPIRVYFLDNSSKVFLATATTTANDIVEQCLEKLGVNNVQVSLQTVVLFDHI